MEWRSRRHVFSQVLPPPATQFDTSNHHFIFPTPKRFFVFRCKMGANEPQFISPWTHAASEGPGSLFFPLSRSLFSWEFPVGTLDSGSILAEVDC